MATAAAADKAQEWWARAKNVVGLEVEEEEPANTSLLDTFSEATTLNKTQVCCTWLAAWHATVIALRRAELRRLQLN